MVSESESRGRNFAAHRYQAKERRGGRRKTVAKVPAPAPAAISRIRAGAAIITFGIVCCALTMGVVVAVAIASGL